MKKIRTFLLLVTCHLSLVTAAGAADLPNILTDDDAQIYQQIFELQSKEKIDAAIKLEKKLSDPMLMNEVLYQRYISKTYRTKGAEIASWMGKYYNMPGAERMMNLAKIKKVQVHACKMPAMLTGKSVDMAHSETWTDKQYSGDADKKIAQFKRAIRTGGSKTARKLMEDSAFKKKLTEEDYGRLAGRLSFLYYTNGEFELAKKWGFVSSDAKSEYGLWTMGLLYYKEQKFAESKKYFSEILKLDQINDARKVEAAFWAGRAAYANDDTKEARKYWQSGAARPMAFYGALSATMLGERPKYEFFEQSYDEEDLEELTKSKYGKMALALLQVDQKSRSEEYLKLMITPSATDRTLHAVDSVATIHALPRVSIQVASVIHDRGILEIDKDIIYSAQYPLPDWEPLGGWSIDRALLFAITKQESNFKTDARSTAGANGLMQLMPGTARIVARQNKMKMSDIDITKPEHNMFLGQQHIVDLFANPAVDNNVIKMLAAYNAGVGMMSKFEKNFDTDDPLLYIESFPAFETRGYIKRVMSNLWLYRARLGQPLTSMEELADGKWPLYNSEDDYVQKQIADRNTI